MPGPQRGVPRQLMCQCMGITALPPTLVPIVDAAVDMYQAQGTLSPPSTFGQDPLAGHQDLLDQRLASFKASFPAYEPLFHGLVNGDASSFSRAVLLFISLTTHLSP